MTDMVEIYTDEGNETLLVGRCRYVAKRRGQSSVFEYADDWIEHPKAYALDPANLPRLRQPFYTNSKQSALPGALRDTAPDRWGQQLIKRAFRKSGDDRTLSEIDYLLAITDRTRIGALRFKREGEDTFVHDIGQYRVPPLIQLPALVDAANAVQSNTETVEDLKLLLHEGSPLGGPHYAIRPAQRPADSISLSYEFARTERRRRGHLHRYRRGHSPLLQRTDRRFARIVASYCIWRSHWQSG